MSPTTAPTRRFAVATPPRQPLAPALRPVAAPAGHPHIAPAPQRAVATAHRPPVHRPVAAPQPARSSRRRGLLLTLGLVAVAAVLGAVLLAPYVSQAIQAIELPLKHEQVIREQAREKNLDPALIAAVINAESRFQPGRVSETGARGYMQLMPETAQAIAEATGGSGFEMSDLDQPETGIAYGSWYLQRLMEHYDGETLLAVAAYNGGMGNVDQWVADDPGAPADFTVDDIPFPETQAYVEKVLDARDGYRDEHGLTR